MPKFKMMKKILFILSALFALTFISCDGIDFTGPGNQNITAPTASAGESGVTISPINIDNISYLNIFRYEVTNNTSSGTTVENSLVNIAQLYPKDGFNGVLQYLDNQIDKSKCYRYFIRYTTTSGYIYSNDSVAIEGSLCTGAKNNGYKELTKVSVFEISYDTNTYTMSVPASEINITTSLAGSPTPVLFDPSTTGMDLFIVISNGTSSRLFPMKYQDNVAGAKFEISLKSSIPQTFYDCELRVKGFVAQLESEGPLNKPTDAKVDYIIYSWTAPLNQANPDKSVNFKLIDLVDNNAELEDCRFEVPSSYESTEFGDYTAPGRSLCFPVEQSVILDY